MNMIFFCHQYTKQPRNIYEKKTHKPQMTRGNSEHNKWGNFHYELEKDTYKEKKNGG